MYFPKHQIKTNLYTNGNELVDSTSQKPYTGTYWINSKGEYFSQEDPTKSFSIRLEPQPINTSTLSQSTPSITIQDNKLVSNTDLGPRSFYIEDVNYYLSKNLPFDRKAPLPPKYFYPTPTEEDYNKGNITRYFAKKVNTNIYIETSFEEYNKLLTRDISIAFMFYIPLELLWKIKGDRSEVIKSNILSTNNLEKKENITGFSSFIKTFDLFWKP